MIEDITVEFAAQKWRDLLRFLTLNVWSATVVFSLLSLNVKIVAAIISIDSSVLYLKFS